MRLERKEQECDELKKKVDQLINKAQKEIPFKEITARNYTTEQINNNDTSKIDYNIYNNKVKQNLAENKKEEVVKENLNPFPESSNDISENKIQTKSSSTVSKSSALVRFFILNIIKDKIRELKEKKSNAPLSRISLTSSIIDNSLSDNPVSSENKGQTSQSVSEEKNEALSNSNIKTQDSSYTNL